MDGCCQLHVHSSLSFKDGLASEAALVQRALELEQPGLGLTNHGNLYAAPRLFKAAAPHKGFKAVIGMEAYEAVSHTWDPDPAGPDHALFKGKYDPARTRYFHLTLWAIDAQGWENLCTLHTLSYTAAYKPKNQPLIDRASLERHHEGLLVGLGCPQSRTNIALRREGYPAAQRAAQWYAEVFAGRLYVEVMSALPDQLRALPDQRKLATYLGCPALAVNDVHYLHQADGVPNGSHHTLVQARKFKSKDTAQAESPDQSDDSYGSWYGSDQFYMKSRAEMLASGLYAAEVDATVALLERVSFDFNKLPTPKPPTAHLPDDAGFEAWLVKRDT